MSYVKKYIIFYQKNLQPTKYINFNDSFVIEFFHSIASYQYPKNNWTFINHGLLFRKKYSV